VDRRRGGGRAEYVDDGTFKKVLGFGTVPEISPFLSRHDALSPWVQNVLGLTLLSTGRYEEGAGHCQKAAAADCLGRARMGQGRIDEAIQILTTVKNPRYLGYALTGDHLCRFG